MPAFSFLYSQRSLKLSTFHRCRLISQIAVSVDCDLFTGVIDATPTSVLVQPRKKYAVFCFWPNNNRPIQVEDGGDI